MTNKTCENCRFFRKHFYWGDGKLLNSYSGHCFRHRRGLLVRFDSWCDKWEQGKNQQTQINENIKTLLLRAAKQIEEIAAILKSDN